MRRLRFSPLAAFGLLALLMLNGLAFGWLSRISSEDTRLAVSPQVWHPDLPENNQASPSRRRQRNTYAETLARPIFSRDRRPYKPPPPAPPPAPPKPKVVISPPPVIANPGLSLSGVAITREGRQAFVKQPSGTNGSWVKEGETVMGWRVKEIAPGRVVLEKSRHSIELQLYKQTATP